MNYGSSTQKSTHSSTLENGRSLWINEEWLPIFIVKQKSSVQRYKYNLLSVR